MTRDDSSMVLIGMLAVAISGCVVGLIFHWIGLLAVFAAFCVAVLATAVGSRIGRRWP